MNCDVRLPDLPLFNANNARRKAEQDSILLANRIRLLRAEEEKARKKIRETEGKTKEIIDLRRRSEEKRSAKDAEDARREALEHEIRSKWAGAREEQQRKIQIAQRELLENKATAYAMLKQDREVHKQQIQHEQQEAAAEAAGRAFHVRRELQESQRRRARSEGARLELCKMNFQEKLVREEEAARNSQSQISRMEKEEAELIQRLQRSQERHRAAFAALEDALSAPQTASSSRCPSSLDQVPLQELPQGLAPSSGSRISLAASSCPSSTGSEPRATASRPPRPRASATPTPPQNAAPGSGANAGKTRPTSATRLASVPRVMPSMASKSVASLRDYSEASICSTRSDGPGQESGASGHSTPTSMAPAITYTTVDGLQLDIPPEEDLDLGKLLSGH